MRDWYCDKLLTGNVRVERIFEDETAIAFWHTKPRYPHHAVVTPRYHVNSLFDCDAGTLVNLLEVVKAVAAQFTVDYGGAYVITNVGGYLESKHLHFHIGAD